MSDSIINIPLFPLNTVLFPQGLLPLRVFETHYLDMVRDCLRNNLPFGVVNIVSGDEINDSEDPVIPSIITLKKSDINTIKTVNPIAESIVESNDLDKPPLLGTLAYIIDFDKVDPMILLIAVKGGDRFKVLHTHTQSNGLLRADVELLPSPIHTVLNEADEACVMLLKRIIEELETQHKEATESGQRTFCFPIEKPYQFNDKAWIAHRFAEMMPISLKHKQLILSLPDAQARLDWVINFLKLKEVV